MEENLRRLTLNLHRTLSDGREGLRRDVEEYCHAMHVGHIDVDIDEVIDAACAGIVVEVKRQVLPEFQKRNK